MWRELSVSSDESMDSFLKMPYTHFFSYLVKLQDIFDSIQEDHFEYEMLDEALDRWRYRCIEVITLNGQISGLHNLLVVKKKVQGLVSKTNTIIYLSFNFRQLKKNKKHISLNREISYGLNPTHKRKNKSPTKHYY